LIKEYRMARKSSIKRPAARSRPKRKRIVKASERDQARAIATLMPALMRMLLTFDRDPAAELPLAQLRVCIILFEGPRSMSALAREFGVSLSAMTRIADRLERTRLVKRVTEGKDRRVRRLQLTPRGEKIMRDRNEARVRSVSAVLTRLPAKARKGVRSALETLMEACTAMKEEGI
jgi:DNA-binding MarR family transcriptional regulator